MHWLFGNIGSLNFANLPNLTLFIMHRAKKKSTFVNITINLISKVFKDWEAFKLTVADKVYHNLIFARKTQSFSLATNITSYFP